MAKLHHDELIQLFQEGRIDLLQFTMNGEQADEFLDFCRKRYIDPTNESARLFMQLRDIEQMELQFINF